MTHRALFAIVACCVLAIGAGAGRASAEDSPLSMSPIQATFVETEFATHYTVDAFDLNSKKLTYHWTLELELIDKAGAPNPGLPGSGAAVDLGCDNHGKLVATTDEFVWHHADAPKDNCDHNKMGPKGHQGSIVLVVSDGTWVCTAEYQGTNDGKSPPTKCAKDDPTAVGSLDKAVSTLNDAIAREHSAVDALKTTPPGLGSAYDNVDKSRLELYDVDSLVAKGGASVGGDPLHDAWKNDLEVEWNINITNSPHVPKSPLDVELDQKRINEAIKVKEAEVARIKRAIRTRH